MLRTTLKILGVLILLGEISGLILASWAATDPNAGLPPLMKASLTATTRTDESVEIIADPEDDDTPPEETYSLFAATPTPTPLPALDPASAEFFTNINEENQYFHQLKQTPHPTSTPASARPLIDPPRTVYQGMLKKGAVVYKYQDPTQRLVTREDYYVTVEVDSYYRPLIILDRDGHRAYQTARNNVVDLGPDLNLKLSPLTQNPRYTWLREELQRQDPAPLLIHRLLGGPGESVLFKTSLPNLVDQSMLHLAMTYQVLYHWTFPVRLGLNLTAAYNYHHDLTWPTISLGPSVHGHFLIGRQQFELSLLWQTLLYGPVSFQDTTDKKITAQGHGSFWQVGLTYFVSWQGHLWPWSVFYQRGSYHWAQPHTPTNYDLENTPQRLHAIGLQIGHQWN